VPTYAYIGITRDGGRRKGTVEAENLAAARRRLREEGLLPLSLAEERSQGLFGAATLRFRPSEELPLVTRHLATLVGAGVPLVPALRSLAAQAAGPATRRLLSDLADAVQEGASLARAVEARSDAFPRLYASMIRAGEESGALALSLARLADHLEGQARARSRIRTALTYPVVMALVASLVVVFLLTFVVPKIVGVFANLGRALPWPTRVLIASTRALSVSWWAIAALLAGIVLWLRRRLATEAGRRARDAVLLRLPVAGRTLHLAALSRFARTLATLAAGGVPLDRALRVTAPAVGNAVLAACVEEAAARVVEGVPLSEGLAAHAEFPPTLVQMVAVGEQSGTLPALLDRTADALDAEVEARTARLLSLLEPAIILVMGAVVALIVVSVLLPMLEISSLVR